MTCLGGELASRWRSNIVESRTVFGCELGMESSSMWIPFGVRSGYTSLSDSVLEPGGAYPADKLQHEGEDEGEFTAARPITHVNHFTLKYDEHHALCTAHIPGSFQRSTYQSPNCSTRQTLYAHSAMGSPTNADRTNQPDGGSTLAVGCTRRPASGRALRRERKGRELGAVLVIEGWCLALRRRAQARDAIDVIHDGDIDARGTGLPRAPHCQHHIYMYSTTCTSGYAITLPGTSRAKPSLSVVSLFLTRRGCFLPALPSCAFLCNCEAPDVVTWSPMCTSIPLLESRASLKLKIDFNLLELVTSDASRRRLAHSFRSCARLRHIQSIVGQAKVYEKKNQSRATMREAYMWPSADIPNFDVRLPITLHSAWV